MKLTIFSRLTVGYLTLFILVGGVGVYAIFKLHQLNKSTRNILRVNSPILDYKAKLTDAILSQLLFKKKYILTIDHLLYNQFLSAKEDFNKFLSEVSSVVDTEEKRSSLNKITLHHERFQSLIDKEIEYVQKNRAYPKRWYEQEIEKSADGILEELKKLEVYSRTDIQRGMKILVESGSSTRRLVITMSIFAILLVIATSIMITRSITQPLAQLIHKTEEISRGVYGCNLEITSPPELMELARAFDSMCAKLNTLDKMKADFFSSMSHELRTPLTSIKEGISLLREGVGEENTDKQKRLLAILSEESKRLIELVNSLLDLSKMEAGMMTYAFEQATLAPLIDRAIMEMAPLIEAKKIIFRKDIEEKLPSLPIDRERMLQVLRNLIGNALKFTPQEGRIKISAQCLNGAVKVSVADTGPGIPEEKLGIIFDKFHQAPLIHSNQIKGTGLGLSIVKHIITAHGGRVWAENQPEQGSLFTFVLPVY